MSGERRPYALLMEQVMQHDLSLGWQIVSNLMFCLHDLSFQHDMSNATNCAGMYSRICDSFTSTTIISFLSPLLPFLLHFCRSVENWELWKVLPLKCEVCRNIAIHASPTEFFVSNLYISSRFNFFLFLQNCSLNFCISNTPLRGKWVGKKLNELGQ